MSGLDAYVESMTKIHTTVAEKPGHLCSEWVKENHAFQGSQ